MSTNPSEVLAELEEVYNTWALADELLIGSQSEIANLHGKCKTLATAVQAVIALVNDTHPDDVSCPEDVIYYDAMQAVRRALTDAGIDVEVGS